MRCFFGHRWRQVFFAILPMNSFVVVGGVKYQCDERRITLECARCHAVDSLMLNEWIEGVDWRKMKYVLETQE